jgi:hypothetical protein
MAFPPPPTTNEVDRLYRKLMEINAIDAAQLAECACCCCSNSTPSLVWARAGRQGLEEAPFVPKTDFSCQALLQQ